MHALSIGPHRGTDWLGRSAMGGREPNVHTERYVVRLHEPQGGPQHARALWLCLRLCADGQATCEAATFADDPQERRQASELWPLERALLDPERSGVGIGECLLTSQSSHGLVRGGDFCISWKFAFVGGAPATSLLPAPFLYRRGWLSHKAALLAAGAKVERGELEVWRALGRAAPVSRIDLAGWSVSAFHLWGSGPFEGYALLDVAGFDGAPDATLSLLTFRSRLGGLRQAAPCLGVLQLDGETVVFAGRQALMRPAGEAPALLGTKWSFCLTAAKGELSGAVDVPPEGRVRLSAEGPAPNVVSAAGRLQASWTPRGRPSRSLSATRVGVEIAASESH